MSITIPKSIALFDFSHALNVAFNALGPDQAGSVVLEQLASLRTACEHVVICIDTKPYWRTTVFDGYKAGRKQEPDLAQIWDRTMQRLLDAGYNMARAPGEEADDVAATLACIYAEEYGCEDVRIVTADKDVAQCINARVRWFVPQLGKRDEFEIRDAVWCTKHFGNVEWEKEKTQKVGPTPGEVPLVLAIMGDTSDKIPGVKGIGIKGAVALVKTYTTPEGMVNGLVAADAEAKRTGKELSKFWQNYRDGMADVPKWLKLTTLKYDVELDAHPLKYLERLMPKETAPDDEEVPEFLKETLDDGAPTAAELEEERLAMDAERQALANELPVGRPLVAEPMPDGPERRAQQARESEQFLPLTPKGAAAPQPTAAASPAAGGAAHDPSKMVIGKDPKADEALRELAAKLPPNALAGKPASTSTETAPAGSGPSAPAQTTSPGSPPAPSAAGAASPPPSATQPAAAPSSSTAAQVVSPRQGPPKPSDPDALVENIAQIVPYAAPSWELSTQPASAGQTFAIAKRLHASKRWLSNYENPESIAAVILRGREMGLGMLTALDSFHVIKGKVCSSSQLLAALAERDPNHEYTMVVELTPRKAVVEIKHRKQPQAVPWTYTIEQAEALGLLKPSPKTGEPSQWVKRPETMLLKTARANGHRFMFPGATLGMHSIETEADAQHLIGDGDA